MFRARGFTLQKTAIRSFALSIPHSFPVVRSKGNENVCTCRKLWNPSTGCGFPTAAELEYCTFSPFGGFFPAADSYLYNLGITRSNL